MNLVERRSEYRVETNAPAQILTLGDHPRGIDGRIVNVSGRGMRLALPEFLAPDTLVRINSGNEMYLGEVAYCRQYGDAWQAGIEVQECLHHTPELISLTRTLAAMDSSQDPSLRDPGRSGSDATIGIAPHADGRPNQS